MCERTSFLTPARWATLPTSSMVVRAVRSRWFLSRILDRCGRAAGTGISTPGRVDHLVDEDVRTLGERDEVVAGGGIAGEHDGAVGAVKAEPERRDDQGSGSPSVAVTRTLASWNTGRGAIPDGDGSVLGW